MILRLIGYENPSASSTRTEMLRCYYSSDIVGLPCSTFTCSVGSQPAAGDGSAWFTAALDRTLRQF